MTDDGDSFFSSLPRFAIWQWSNGAEGGLKTELIRQDLICIIVNLVHLQGEGCYIGNGTVGVAEIQIFRQSSAPYVVFDWQIREFT